MIEVQDLTFSYGKDKQVLHGLNFSVRGWGNFRLFRGRMAPASPQPKKY